jgi:hypothetical protein
MRFIKILLPVAILFFGAFKVTAQEEVPQFTVQIGNFVNPKPADFAQLRTMGFVYAMLRPSNYTDVFIGGYDTETEANKVVMDLKGKGYDNAFVSKLNVEGGKSVTIIQLATKRVGEKINWEEYGQLDKVYVLLNGSQIKIVTGIFPELETAKKQLPNLKKLGFTDAFVKNVNNALLHEVGEFETGGAAKKPLIPLDFSEKPATKEDPRKDVPTQYEDVAVIGSAGKASTTTPKSVESTPATTKTKTQKEAETPKEAAVLTARSAAPSMRANVKRTSALELQKVLKSEGAYKGSLDGYYGNGTKAAYEVAKNSNRQIQKYRILSRHMQTPGSDAPRGTDQYNINNLWDDPKTALDGLEKSKNPIAKAYRAYFLYVTDGASKDVNTLMNAAIEEAFTGKKTVNFPKFDYTATYAYYDLDQLLLHIRYLHEVSPEKPAAPCWLFRKHPGAALKAFEPKGSSDSDVTLQNCGGFWEWEEIQILHAMAQDLGAQSQISEAKMSGSYSKLASLYLTPKALQDEERKALETWNTNLWKGIDGWATRDPMLSELGTSLKIAYLQSWAMLEDYYMDEGFDAKDAKALALASLKALVGHQLERFV